MLQLSGNNGLLQAVLPEPAMKSGHIRTISLAALRKGDDAILERIDLPADDARRLMELGFVPGVRIASGCSAPGGDPRVFRVDGSEIALRRETARHITVRVENLRRG